MKSNVADLICGYLEASLKLPLTIYIDMIPDDGEGICIRHDPAPAAEERFIDGSRQVQWNFTFYARFSDARRARKLLKAVTDKLDGAAIKDPETETEIDCEAATLPQFVGVNDKKMTICCAAITAEFLEEADNE